ncbi:YhcB family protein [Motilimonas pumila]|uniref:Z-ring associated protein G n=1 Tax=Motilimonas pumila TaxID=2303987 RepID=A0A418YI58_9GAMM|nr:DUF1043 family protein [Motilimonas pumila]RJG50016.1 DUF1043 family protein [Motilimonas pumila]
MIIYAVISLAIILVIAAFFIGKKTSQRRFQVEREALVQTHQRECEQYKQEIDKLKQTHHQQEGDQQEYQSHVSQHFTKSAELMAEMAKQYQDVYQHMSDTAHQLLPEAEASALLLKAQRPDVNAFATETPHQTSTSSKADEEATIDMSQPTVLDEAQQEPKCTSAQS